MSTQRTLDTSPSAAGAKRPLLGRTPPENRALPGGKLFRPPPAVLSAADTAPAALPLDVEGPAPSRAPGMSVRCLGTFEVRIAGQPVENWRPRKARALFQYLINHHDRPITREALMEALWPDPEAVAPSTSLKVAVHTLRQILGRIGDGQPPLALDKHEAGYQLRAESLWLDVEEFERCCLLGRRLMTQGGKEEALALYGAAADLYRGDFLTESWEDWVIFRRERLKDQYLLVLAPLAEAALEAGDYQGCVLHCQQLLEQDRCREDTYRTLMLCHAQLGQRERVRCWYALCVRTLRNELDAAPEPETKEVYRQALGGQALADLAR